MKKYMYKPIEYTTTDEDVIAEYLIYKDKKKVAKIFCITVKLKQVNDILKSRGM